MPYINDLLRNEVACGPYGSALGRRVARLEVIEIEALTLENRHVD